MKILITGNIIKDVYLKLDENTAEFEADENGTPWLDLAFNGSHHDFTRRTSVFAGSAVTAEVFRNLGLDAEMAGRKLDFSLDDLTGSDSDSNSAGIHIGDGRPCDTYRYILCDGDRTTYLVPAKRTATRFSAPEGEAADWIFVDRSATISRELAGDIEKYVKLSGKTKVASFISTKHCSAGGRIDMRRGRTRLDDGARKLAEISTLVFSDGDLFDLKPASAVCRISDERITLGRSSVSYRVGADDKMTHLTIYSTIAATVFGAIVSGMSVGDALMLAAVNAENARITGTLKLTELKEKLMEKKEKQEDLRMIAKTLTARGKGILAADESGGSIHKKFEAAGIPDDEQHRRDYRNIFFTTPGLQKYVNGVILFDETARQKADDGRTFTEYLTGLGVIPGIKVDRGLVPFADPDHADEKWTQGLEGLPERLAEYYEMGLRFAKWRAAFEVKIEDGEIKTPSDFAITENAKILARYALDCQEAGIVPIVEPELVHDGDYSIEVCKLLTGKILDATFAALRELNVDLSACILKCNMTLAGKRFEHESDPAEVGKATAETLRVHVPEELAGVVFLSGGQGVEESTLNLQAVTNNGPFPWPVTFSFARALQGPALDAWKGDDKNADAAREAFFKRLVANCDALKK